MQSEELPISAQFLQLVTAKWVVKPMYVAAKMHIADHIKAGIRDIEGLAEKTSADPDMLYRLLRALSSVGIFREEADRHFSLTPMAECLLDEPGSPRGMLMFLNDPVHDSAWDQLQYSVQSGKQGFEQAHGAGIFEYCKTDLEFSEVFNVAMTSNAQAVHNAVCAVLDTTDIGTIYDIGGGHGHLVKGLMDKNPGLKGGVFDLPHVVEGADNGSGHDLEIMGGSFFEEIPNGADAHIMSFIIHDWDDESSVKILKTCHKALPEGGKVFICDTVVGPPNEPDLAKLLDTEMIVMTTGKERTAAEFEALLEQAGFAFEAIIETPGPQSIVCAVK